MAKFEDAIGTVLKNEGGYVNNPADPGGETKYGISKRSYPNVDIKNLTEDEAKEIYKRDFWKFDGIDSQEVATKIFDAMVNMGSRAIKFAQQLVGTVVDGKYGAKTEAAINAQDPVEFLKAYRDKMEQFYRNLVLADPSKAQFLKGWLRRARQ